MAAAEGATLSALTFANFRAHNEENVYAGTQSRLVTETSTHTQSSASGEFEACLTRLCRGSWPYQLQNEDESLRSSIDAVLSAAAAEGRYFVPMRHLWKMLRLIVEAISSLDASSDASAISLITGPQGIGKTTLLQLVRDPSVLQAIRAPETQPKEMMVSYVLASGFDRIGGHSKSSLCTWILDFVAGRLQGQSASKELLQYVQSLSKMSVCNRNRLLSDFMAAGVSLCPASLDGVETGKYFPTAGSHFTYFSLLDAALGATNKSVLLLIDDVEALFKAQHVDRETAAAWVVQLKQLPGLRNIGLIMCTSFQRARQLFLTPTSSGQLPKDYTHLDLCSTWKPSKLHHGRVHPPLWTRQSLTRFILAHSLHAQHICVSKHFPRASLEASRLDSIFSHGSDDLSEAAQNHTESLEVMLEAFGHSPRLVVQATDRVFRQLPKNATWPSARQPVASFSPTDPHVAGQVQSALSAFWNILEKTHPPSSRGPLRLLDYDPLLFTVNRDAILAHLNASSKHVGSSPSTSVMASAPLPPSTSDALIQAESLACLNLALDLGFLVSFPDSLVAAADPTTRASLACRGLVSPTVLSWLSHGAGSFAEYAELSVARVLARSGLLFASACKVLEGAAARVSNDDQYAGCLSQLHLIALGPHANLLTPTSVTITDMKPFIEFFGIPPQGHDESWAAIAREASARNIHPRAIAANISMRRTEDAVLRELFQNGNSVILKESPGALGADLTGLDFQKVQGVMKIEIVRVQVMLATQESLMKGVGSRASNGRVNQALQAFSGKQQKRSSSGQTRFLHHEAACNAISDMILGLRLAHIDVNDLGKWLTQFCTMDSTVLHFSSQAPVIATTHIPDKATEKRVRSAGAILLCGGILQPHWGALGEVCKKLGVLLASSSRTPESLTGGAGLRVYIKSCQEKRFDGKKIFSMSPSRAEGDKLVDSVSPTTGI